MHGPKQIPPPPWLCGLEQIFYLDEQLDTSIFSWCSARNKYFLLKCKRLETTNVKNNTHRHKGMNVQITEKVQFYCKMSTNELKIYINLLLIGEQLLNSYINNSYKNIYFWERYIKIHITNLDKRISNSLTRIYSYNC